MITKINEIKNYVSNQFVEREEIVEAILLSLVARQHCLLIGPPGTGKSALISEIANSITDINYFQWLLSRFSTPEELYGPVSLKELEKGIYKRNTTNKIPEAHVSFIDEVFKANSAILNSLLTLINERLFYNNGTPSKSPLISVIGASNEYPEDEEGLEALFDRFLLRFEVEYIGEDQNFVSMLKGESNCKKPSPLSLADLQEIQFFADMVAIPEEVVETLVRIRTNLRDEGVRPSDRRFKQSLSLLQAKAVLDGRQNVEIGDLLILKNGLWETVEQKAVVQQIVEDHAQDRLVAALTEIQNTATEIWEYVDETKCTDAGLEANQKYKQLSKELTELKVEYPKRTDEINVVHDDVKAVQKQIAETILGI